jgi:hypothetical protein
MGLDFNKHFEIYSFMDEVVNHFAYIYQTGF